MNSLKIFLSTLILVRLTLNIQLCRLGSRQQQEFVRKFLANYITPENPDVIWDSRFPICVAIGICGLKLYIDCTPEFLHKLTIFLRKFSMFMTGIPGATVGRRIMCKNRMSLMLRRSVREKNKFYSKLKGSKKKKIAKKWK